MSCTLFVPEVRGSKICSVCRKTIKEHKLDAIYVEPRRIFPKLPPPDNKPEKSMNSISTSQFSAFLPYPTARNKNGSSPASSSTLPPIIRPEPRLAVPNTLPQEDRSDSRIYQKIQGRQKERSASVGELRSPSSEDDEEIVRSSRRSSPLHAQRSSNFKRILQRFQSADQTTPEPRRRNTTEVVRETDVDSKMIMNPIAAPRDAWSPVRAPRGDWSPVRAQREVWSPAREQREHWSPTRSSSAPRDSWSPVQRSSISSPYRSSAGSRNTSARSRMSMTSLQSPLSFYPTRESSPRVMPSPSLIPNRGRSSSEDQDGHSPLSHTGSTPEPVVRRPPLHVNVPTPKRRSLPGRWVKETDIDAPLPMSPLSSPAFEEFNSAEILNGQSAQNLSTNNAPSSESSHLSVKTKSNGRHGGSCRRVLSGMENNKRNSPNGVYVRRSRSKDDKVHATPARSNNNGSESSGLHNIPIFMSAESIRSQYSHPSPNPNTEQSTDKEMYKHQQQIALSHVQTLSIVADRLAEEMSRGEEPVSRNRISSLDFSHFVVSGQPVLTKGKSLFYNAVLPRSGQADYPVTLMIAPCSQYAPLMRQASSQLFSVPGFLEMEDHDGGIRRFLEHTGTHNLDGKNTKVVAMPRMNLCSFHSLAAHHLNQRLEKSSHEELICFILLQLLAALKMLQSEGIEALSANFKEFLLAYRFSPVDSQAQMRDFPRLIFLSETLGAEVESGEEELVGLCRYALRALCTLLHHRMDGKAPPLKLRSGYSRALQACANLLAEDKSSSLTKAKNVLELALWWTADPPRTEFDCRRSIDIARADCVDSLLRQLVCEPGCRLGSRERLRVEFLLGATPRSLIDSHNAIMSANLS